MKIVKKVGMGLPYILSGVLAFLLVLLLIIKINSAGVEEPFLDEHGNGHNPI